MKRSFLLVFCLLHVALLVAQTDSTSNELKLIQAAEKGDASTVLELLNQGVKVDCTSWDGMSPLHYAAQNGHLKAAEVLLLNGADANKKDNDGRTPLLLAVHFEHLDIAEYLVQRGADLNIKDKAGLTPLFYASAYGDFIMAEMFLFYEAKLDAKDPDGKTEFLAAVWGGHIEVSRLLLDFGSNINDKDAFGLNALMLAILNRDSVMVDSLIAWKIDLNHTEDQNYTALEIAIKEGQNGVAQKLIQARADVNHTISKSFKTFDLAISTGSPKSLKDQLKLAGATISKLPVFHRGEAGFILRANTDDSRLGLQIAISDQKYQWGFKAGIMQKPGRDKVIHDISDFFAYQFRETRTDLLVGTYKDFALNRISPNRQLGFFVGISGITSFGDYKATSKMPPVYLRAIAEAGLYARLSWIVYKISYCRVIPQIRDYQPDQIMFSANYILTEK